MKKISLNILSFFFLSSYFPDAQSKLSVECYPSCTESQIATAKRELKSEISSLTKKYQGLESKANLLQNDISMVKFNQRRQQVGSSVKSTSTTRNNNQYDSNRSTEELDRLNERLDKLQESMFDLEKERDSMTAYLEDFTKLVPAKPAEQRPVRALTNNPYGDEPDRSLGNADFYYNDDDELVLNVGDFYALLVGVNEYESDEIVDLYEPVEDAKSLRKVLLDNYEFTQDKTILLENPTRANLLDSLENLATTIKANDSLLIFYAGHGYWDEKFKQGYWLPADARQKTKAS